VAKIDPNDPRPPYQQIADDLRRAIGEGELRPGERMPSSREFATSYGVAPMTVHQAIRVLRDEGLVNSWQGRGVFVRSESDAEQSIDLSAQLQETRQRVDDLSSRIDSDVTPEIGELRRQLGVVQAQLMELYARTGHPYPHDEATTTPESRNTERRRKATGA
jgi:GntR family transcriptional regulator